MTHESVNLYVRQSVSDADDTLSLQSQRATLRRWATEQGWYIVAEITDADAKGWGEPHRDGRVLSPNDQTHHSVSCD